jgi:flagellar basal body-associated protein FliL
MDTQTLILLSVGLITLATMVYCIMKSDDDESNEQPKTSGKKKQEYDDEPEEVFYDDDETSVYTIDDGAEESIFDSE